MRGDLSDDTSKYGIIQRSIEQLFRQFQEKMYSNVSMKCTFLEVFVFPLVVWLRHRVIHHC